MKCIIKTTLTLLSFLALPSGVIYAQDPTWFTSIVGSSAGLFPELISLLVAAAVLFIVWGLVLFIVQAENEVAREEGKQRMIWGIIALFVMVSVWGFVALLQTISGVGGQAAPPAPQTGYITTTGWV